jgi:hypothetical protein
MDTWDLIKSIILAILIVAIVIVVVTIAFIPAMRASCDATTKDIGMPHRWSFWGGCQIQENNNWIPLDNWRYLGDK